MIDDAMNRLKVKRGSELPQAKLTEDDVRLIRQAVEERERLRAEASRLTNKSLAEFFNVHRRTIDRVTEGYNWTQI